MTKTQLVVLGVIAVCAGLRAFGYTDLALGLMAGVLLTAVVT